jgi:hypothetical protein
VRRPKIGARYEDVSPPFKARPCNGTISIFELQDISRAGSLFVRKRSCAQQGVVAAKFILVK